MAMRDGRAWQLFMLDSERLLLPESADPSASAAADDAEQNEDAAMPLAASERMEHQQVH